MRIVLVALGIALIVGARDVSASPATYSRSGADSHSCADSEAVAALAKPEADGRPLLFDQFMNPMVEEANRRRASMQAKDPAYAYRVDHDLNSARLNVALLGYGEEHDQTYDDMGISVTILSLNLDTWDMSSISLSRDIRAPELEDHSAQEPPRWPLTIRAAYKAGGFDEVRAILEDATGLAIDFQVLMKDIFLRNYIHDVNGPIELAVPKDFSTNAYRLDGVEHEPDFIPAGRQTLSTEKAMAFVLAETLDPRGKVDERSYRKDLLLKIMSCEARQRFAAKDVGFALSLVRFSLGELKNQDLDSDFDFQMITGALGSLAQAFITNGGQVDTTFPQLGGARELVIHDEAFGDGGVRRVHHMAAIPDNHGIADNPLVEEEIAMGSLAPYMLIPIGGNPYATDVVNDYWGSVRALVKMTLVRAN